MRRLKRRLRWKIERPYRPVFAIVGHGRPADGGFGHGADDELPEAVARRRLHLGTTFPAQRSVTIAPWPTCGRML